MVIINRLIFNLYNHTELNNISNLLIEKHDFAIDFGVSVVLVDNDVNL